MNENDMAIEALKWILMDIKERKNESEKEAFDDLQHGSFGHDANSHSKRHHAGM